MAYKILSIVLIVIAAITKPRKECLLLVKLVYRASAVKVAVLFAAITPHLPGALKEVISGEVPLLATMGVGVLLVTLQLCACMCWKVADACTVQISTRFSKQ